MEEGPGEEDEAERALREVRDALLDHRDGHLVPARVARAVVRLGRVGLDIGVAGLLQARAGAGDGVVARSRVVLSDRCPALLVGLCAGGRRLDVVLRGAAHDEERRRVDRRLRDEAVGSGHTQQAGNEGCNAEEEEVVMEPWRFPQGKLRALRH